MNEIYEKLFSRMFGEKTPEILNTALKRIDQCLLDLIPEDIEIFHEICGKADAKLHSGEFTPEQSVNYQYDEFVKHGICEDKEGFIRIWSRITNAETWEDIIQIEVANVQTLAVLESLEVMSDDYTTYRDLMEE